ncbi:arsenate resistance ArsH, partial [Ascobolus immersus RN42]
MSTPTNAQGDLNNIASMREVPTLTTDPQYAFRSLAISKDEDDAEVRLKYRPFLLPEEVQQSDWVSKLELSTVVKIAEENLAREGGEGGHGRLKVLVLYGSLRSRSFSKFTAYECARILHRLGCDVRVYDPAELPVKDDVQFDHPKVQELRDLSRWSDGHVWVSPEQHGQVTGVFKNQIDWIPLSVGSVRPTQNRTLSILQVNGGSQSFNAVNTLRILGRWMRMFTIPNQSSIPKAWTEYTDPVATPEPSTMVEKEGGNRLKPSSLRDRVVDCMEEFVKVSWLLRPWVESGVLGDRYSERREREAKEE